MIFGKRTRASINRTSPPQEREEIRQSEDRKNRRERERERLEVGASTIRERERGVTELLPTVHRPSQEQTLVRLFFLVLFFIISPRGNPSHHKLE